MAGYLIAEEGPLLGLVVSLGEGQEWILGRDPDESNVVLEDPRVSRRHVIIRHTEEGYVVENLSSTNPALLNGSIILEPALLRENDHLQIGNTIFAYSQKEQSSLPEEKPSPKEVEELFSTHLPLDGDTRWMIKVISGVNAGAEFNLEKGKTYIIGKDSAVADILFQDLSVSKRHAKIIVDESEDVSIEDLDSKNGTILNGEIIKERKPLFSQDIIALGTTTFLILDRHESTETIYTPPPMVAPAEASTETIAEEPLLPATPKNWKDMVISTRHLIMAGSLGVVLIIILIALFSLFKTQDIPIPTKSEQEKIEEVISRYPSVTFTFSPTTGKLFLVGHVLTPVQKQELVYLLKAMPFIQKIEDTVVIDELVWQNTNSLLSSNSAWQSVTISSTAPGKFVIRGYVTSSEALQALTDFLNLNFPYLDKLENQVVIAGNLNAQIDSLLLQYGFGGVLYTLTDGDLVLSGMVNEGEKAQFDNLVDHFRHISGVRNVKNYVVYTNADTSRIDLTAKYAVTGVTKKGDSDVFVMIGGRIYSVGDTLDGYVITGITSSEVQLEKDGLKYKINYNLQ